jgi:two-component system response regulator FixJ
MLDEIPVHVVDDDEAVRASFRFLLKAAGIPSRGYASAENFLAEHPDMKSGCVVTDMRLPGMSGLDLLRHIKNQIGASVSVIVITGHADIPLAVEATKLGAGDFFEKPVNGPVLIAAVRAALAKASQDDQHEIERADAVERIRQLSPREKSVLDGLVAGKPNKVIAFELNISPRTVEIYRAGVMTKMRVASLSRLVRLTLLAEGSVVVPPDPAKFPPAPLQGVSSYIRSR